MRRILTSYEPSSKAPSATTAALALLSGLLSGLVLTGCSSSSHKAAPDPYRVGPLPAADLVAKAKVPGHWVKQGDETLRFTGQVGQGSAAEFAAVLATAPKATTIVATVSGGDLNEGLAIGRTLHDRKLALTIEGPCLGPCADYWFPASAKRTASSGSWLGYVPDLAETPGVTAQERAVEAKLYTDSGVDGAKFHAALDAQLRATPGAQTPPPVSYWMPDKADLVGLGYPEASLVSVWLPPNLTSANAHAHAWGNVVSYKNTLVGLPPVPSTGPTTAPPPPGQAKTGQGPAGQAPAPAAQPAAPAAPTAPAAGN